MSPWPYVIAAYGITLIGAVATSLWAWRTALRAEARADALRDRT